jgi:hypothetical protein
MTSGWSAVFMAKLELYEKTVYALALGGVGRTEAPSAASLVTLPALPLFTL